jgi:hypothetical protein
MNNPYLDLIRKVEERKTTELLRVAEQLNAIEFRHYNEPPLLGSGLGYELTVIGDTI